MARLPHLNKWVMEKPSIISPHLPPSQKSLTWQLRQMSIQLLVSVLPPKGNLVIISLNSDRLEHSIVGQPWFLEPASLPEIKHTSPLVVILSSNFNIQIYWLSASFKDPKRSVSSQLPPLSFPHQAFSFLVHPPVVHIYHSSRSLPVYLDVLCCVSVSYSLAPFSPLRSWAFLCVEDGSPLSVSGAFSGTVPPALCLETYGCPKTGALSRRE